MDRTQAERPIPLFLAALVAVFSALAALAVSNGHDAHAHGTAPDHATVPTYMARSSATVSRKELVLGNGMRQRGKPATP